MQGFMGFIVGLVLGAMVMLGISEQQLATERARNEKERQQAVDLYQHMLRKLKAAEPSREQVLRTEPRADLLLAE